MSELVQHLLTWLVANLKGLLEVSALILAIVNGLILLWNFQRDKPRLVVEFVHPDHYQWFFKLPAGQYQGCSTRRYGFLLYLSINNTGLRDVALKRWSLRVKTGKGWRELSPLSIPEPRAELPGTGSVKVFPVLGQRTLLTNSHTMVKSGDSISGMVYYHLAVYGDSEWDPVMRGGKPLCVIEVESVFGVKSAVQFQPQGVPLDKVTELIEGIGAILE